MSSEVCAYCGQPVLTGTERPEHPIPAALGSSFAVSTVCDACNEWANRHVDQPFLKDDWVLIHRADHDIRDDRRATSRPVPHPLRSGTTKDGRRATLSEAGDLTLYPRVDHHGLETTVQANSMEEAEAIIEQIRQRAARDGMSIEVGSIRIETGPVDITMRVRMDLKAWMRMGAKIALGAASVAYPSEWRTGPDADYLRRLLRDGHDEGHVLFPEQVDDDHVFRQLVDEPEHAMWFLGQEPTKLMVVLFGGLLFAMPVHAAAAPIPKIAWRLDPRRPRANGEITWDEMLLRVIERNPAPDWD
ncbi:MAG: HNH endonuclease [Solirubrobacteraceae bacterium]